MNERLTNLIIFAVGTAVGSAVTYTLLKTKFEQMAQDEIEEVRNLYLKKTEELNESNKETSSESKVSEYEKALNGLKYMNDIDDKKEEEVMKEDKPYVISPNEFGELDGYETNSLTYYADGVLTDDTNTVIDNVDEVVGTDSLTRFGEYEDDSVFVRNDRHECDYEILLDNRRFSDIYK